MKNIIITGASSGIGLSLCKHYQQQGWQVYGACRQASTELAGLNISVIENVDISKQEGIQALNNSLSNISIDLLINNAGVLKDEVLGRINFDSIQSQMEVNAYGPLKVTEALQGNFSQNAKVAMITSRMGSIADNTSGGRYGYRMSKAALNIASVSIAHDLKHKGVAVGIIHPGLVGTRMIGGYGNITPDQAAARIAQRIDELNLNNSGTFWHSNGETLPW